VSGARRLAPWGSNLRCLLRKIEHGSLVISEGVLVADGRVSSGSLTRHPDPDIRNGAAVSDSL
jgi:hypothetical protein